MSKNEKPWYKSRKFLMAVAGVIITVVAGVSGKDPETIAKILTPILVLVIGYIAGEAAVDVARSRKK